jgi:hypothetical protein
MPQSGPRVIQRRELGLRNTAKAEHRGKENSLSRER